MNDKDKEELEKKLQDYELDWIKMRGIAEKLQAENKKLREALEFYAVNGLAMVEVGMRIDERLTKEFYINGSYAREALKEITTN
jgi:uncharacterized lipoprotein YehR (DUF1307 family)